MGSFPERPGSSRPHAQDVPDHPIDWQVSVTYQFPPGPPPTSSHDRISPVGPLKYIH